MRKRVLIFGLVLVLVLVVATPVLAYDPPKPITGSGALENLSQEPDAGNIINNVVLYITYLLGGLFVLMMIIGAIMYMVYPDAEKKKQGMTMIQAAIIAGIIALLSYAIWGILNNVFGNEAAPSTPQRMPGDDTQTFS